MHLVLLLDTSNTDKCTDQWLRGNFELRMNYLS